MEKNYEVIQIDENTWRIENVFVRFFLLRGSEKAILIDTGLDVENVKGLARQALKDDEIPLELINTHSDADHCNGNKEFDWFYMHKADIPRFTRQFGEGSEIREVKEGDIIDLGNRPLEIIEIPGHTNGSIAILDINARTLYAGDSVQDGDIFMFGEDRDLDAYPQSLLKLQDMDDRFDRIYSFHATPELEPDYIGKLFDAVEAILHGEVECEERDAHIFNIKVNAYNCGVATYLIDHDRSFPEE